MAASDAPADRLGRIIERPSVARWAGGALEYGTLSDETLAANFLAGDVAAFEALVVRYSRPIYNFAYRVVGNPDDANDVAQATFLQLFTHLAGVRLDQSLRPWLFQIARNKAIDVLRSRRQVVFSDVSRDDEDCPLVEQAPDVAPLPEAIVEHADLQRILGEAIACLPPKYRVVVALRYTTDLTFKEMGEALGIPENTVKTLFQRAKTRLRAILGELVLDG